MSESPKPLWGGEEAQPPLPMVTKLGLCPITPFNYSPFGASSSVLDTVPVVRNRTSDVTSRGSPLCGDAISVAFEHDFTDFSADSWAQPNAQNRHRGSLDPTLSSGAADAINPHPLRPSDPDWTSDLWREEAVSGLQLEGQTQIRGRLRQHLSRWEDIGAS